MWRQTSVIPPVPMRPVEAAIRDLITHPSERDEQILIGPSELGNPCDRCLGLRLAHRVPDGPRPRSIDNFGLKSWTGTATHDYLKKQGRKNKRFRRNTFREATIPVCEIKNYGEIKGHCDLMYHGGTSAVDIVDYKTKDLRRIKLYQKQGVPEQYEAQIDLYAFGALQSGLVTRVDEVGLFFIPRDSNSLDDAWYWHEPYDEDIALRAIKHAKKIWKRVQRGEIEFLTSDPDCYDCAPYRDIEIADS